MENAALILSAYSISASAIMLHVMVNAVLRARFASMAAAARLTARTSNVEMMGAEACVEHVRRIMNAKLVHV